MNANSITSVKFVEEGERLLSLQCKWFIRRFFRKLSSGRGRVVVAEGGFDGMVVAIQNVGRPSQTVLIYFASQFRKA